MTTETTFDIRDPLPTGTTLLEASAGTGKTWTIAALVTRFVAEGEARLDEMLVVTFGRAASQELRERVRAQLVEAERALAHPEAQRPVSELLDLLLTGTPEELAMRRKLLREALATFDAATIATIHQFCQLVLRSLGVAGDTDANAVLVEDLDDLVTEVVDDLYLRRFAGAEEPPPFSRSEALALGREADKDPRARLEPAGGDPGSVPAQRVAFAREVLVELAARKRQLGILSYDDLLGQLADALVDDAAPARSRMRARWKVALVDEFQDTDPIQWQVFERAFSGIATMVLIGDPKQAIYAFRGGDVYTYLAAARTATTRQTLGTNWRADSALLERLQTVLQGASLGDERIVVHDVRANHQGSRLIGAGDPFRLRVIRHEELGRSPHVKLTVAPIREHLVEDVARDIKRLLTAGARFVDHARGERPLEPRDVAVIAYRHADLQAIQGALGRHGVPAVVAGGGSVFHTTAATDWLTLLEALEQPHRTPRVRAAALTPFLGHTAAALDAGGDALNDQIVDRVREWAELLGSRGVAAVLEAAAADGLTARVLGCVGGERRLTDLRHIGQSLHKVALEERLGLVALTGWLRLQMADDKVEVASERTRRLDSDAAAVQLVTIHGSKGLEYPVVYLPTLWDRYESDPQVPLFHDHATGERCRNVGGAGPEWADHLGRHRAEDRGEWLRLLYVAATRAQSQVVAWYAPAPNNTPCSPLHRMLVARRPGSAEVPDKAALDPAETLVQKLDWYAANGGPVWEPAVWAELGAEKLDADRDPLGVREFTRKVDTTWRRTSYSALSAAGSGHGAAPPPALSEPESPPRDDEPEGVDPAVPTAPSFGGPVSLWGELPVGATFGSLVHAVLEHADPSAPDLRAELLAQITEQLVWWPVALDAEQLADALVAVCDTPLGPLTDGATLRGIGRADRLTELDFELPLCGGDDTTYAASEVTLGALAPLLRRHLPDGDPLRAYADALAAPALGGQLLRGYLTGSVDVVMRVPVGGETRYLNVDYKTNWLGRYDEPLTAEAYHPAVLAEAMGHSDYPLQALLYTVVQHRFLRWRLPGYDPERHLGGVLYLYLRGMCGPATPVVDGNPCGVFSWKAPVALVEELSQLLDGGAA